MEAVIPKIGTIIMQRSAKTKTVMARECFDVKSISLILDITLFELYVEC